MEELVKKSDSTIAAAPRDDVDRDDKSLSAGGEYFGDILQRRVSRRSVLKGTGAVGVGLVAGSGLLSPGRAEADDHGYRGPRHRRDPGQRIGFEPIAPSSADKIVVPKGYDYNIIIKWGDPLHSDGPAFDVDNQTRESQEQQFGFNCDFIGFYPLHETCDRRHFLFGRGHDDDEHKLVDRGLLAVNHEYTSGGEMFPGYDGAEPTQDQVEAEIAAHGMSVVEIERSRYGGWHYVQGSAYNRRITGYTMMQITGPLKGDPLLHTEDGYDDSGEWCRGMFNNCAGGKTPWGTVLTCEENFDQYFANYAGEELSARIPASTGATRRKWERFEERFDLGKHPNEYHRFGYVVEIDPHDPDFVPRKRTALGRFKHEGAVPAIAKDGRVAVYSGDDARFEYLYKFITAGSYCPDDRTRNLGLLDEGTLYVAKFYADGTGEWLKLPNDAKSLVNTRGSADAVGATMMDRPEDVDVSAVTNKVYVALTNNTRRDDIAEDAGEVAANPRLENEWGHIVEITEDGDDNGALSFRWEIFMLCGDPAQQDGITDLADLAGDDGDNIPGIPDATYFAGFDPSKVSPIAAPDNLVLDDAGNLWVATDGQPGKPFFGQNDGVFAVPTEGPDRGYIRQFLSGIPGGEVCGPEFSSDYRTFFCGIQHPGEGGGLPNSDSSWPDGNSPVKPSVISVWNMRGGKIGEGHGRRHPWWKRDSD